MHSSKLASLSCSVALALLAVSFSIAVPILFRPFYYVQIGALDLPEQTGWSQETIREAYDEILDFCVLGRPLRHRAAALVGIRQGAILRMCACSSRPISGCLGSAPGPP